MKVNTGQYFRAVSVVEIFLEFTTNVFVAVK